MKKIYALLFAVLCIAIFSAYATAATYCDVDGNDKIEAADARLALRAAVGLETYGSGSNAFLAADYNGSGTIDADDARSILRAAVGLAPTDLVFTEKTHVDLLPGGTEVFSVLIRNGFDACAETESDALRVELTNNNNGFSLLFISGCSVCENAVVKISTPGFSKNAKTVTVTVKEDENKPLNVYSGEQMPDFGAMTGLAPEQTDVDYRLIYLNEYNPDHFAYYVVKILELEYQPGFSVAEAERAFYAYAVLLGQSGYAYLKYEEDGIYRRTYIFGYVEYGSGVSYTEEWSDETGEPIVQNVKILWHDMDLDWP